MRRILLSVFLLFCSFAPSPAHAEERDSVPLLSIAVNDLIVRGGTPDQQWIGEQCAEGIAVRLASERSLRIVERKYLQKIIDELKFQESGLVDEQHAVTLGALTGARYLLLGGVTVVERTVHLRVRLVTVETGEMFFSCEANGGMDDVFRLPSVIARKIAVRLLGQTMISSDSAGTSSSPLTAPVRATIRRLEKMAHSFPLFALDPARKRKSAEFTAAGLLYDNIIDLAPDAVTGYRYKALFCMHAEEYEEAGTALRSALRIAPDDADLLLLRASLLFHTGQYDASRVVLLYLTERSPNDSRPWYGLAKCAARQNDHPLVAEALVRCLQGTPFLPEAETFLESELSMHQFSSGEPLRADVANALRLFQSLHGTGRPLQPDDLPLTVSVARAFPGLYIPHLASGTILNTLGRMNEAESFFRRSLACAPAQPFIHRALAYLYLRNGRCDEGRQHATLYLQTAQSIEDYPALRQSMENCMGSQPQR